MIKNRTLREFQTLKFLLYLNYTYTCHTEYRVQPHSWIETSGACNEITLREDYDECSTIYFLTAMLTNSSIETRITDIPKATYLQSPLYIQCFNYNTIT